MRHSIHLPNCALLTLAILILLPAFVSLATSSAWGQDQAAASPSSPSTDPQNSKKSEPPLLHIVPMQKGADNNFVPATAKLVYNGGPVISNAQVVVVFWGSGVDSTVQSSIGGFYQTIVASNYYSLLGEYNTPKTGTNQIIGQGTFLNAYTITPSICGTGAPCTIDDSQISPEITSQITAGALPAPVSDAAGNVNTVYMIYFPVNVTITLQGAKSCQVFCAYHNSAFVSSRELAYGVIPDQGPSSACNGGCGSSTNPFDNVTSISSHELAEAVTDTQIGENNVAWYDNSNGEIGDICNAQQAPADGYTVQKLWSNAFNACISAVPSYQLAAPASATAGTGFTMTVTALTTAGTTDTTYSGTVHFTSSDPLAVLPADYAFNGADGGVHNFSVTLGTQGTQSIRAMDTAYGGRSGNASIPVSVDNVTHFSVSAPTSATTAVPFNVTVTALDQSNQTVTGYTGTIHFSSSDGAAVLPANSTLSSGVGVFSATLKTLGSQSVSVADISNGTLTGSSSVLVGPGPASHFSVIAPSPDTAGTPFNIAVTALDTFNNVATGYTGTVKFGSTDGAAILPPNSTLNNGAGSFSVTLNTQGNQSVSAVDSLNGTISGSATVNVLPAGVQTTATALSSTLNPSTYGVPVTFTANVTAASGIPQGTVQFKAGSLVLGGVSLLNGYASLTTAYLRPGTATVTATYKGNPHFLTSSNSLVQVQGRALTGTDVSSSANPATAGQIVTFTVTVDSIGGIPAGKVSFADGSKALATIPLNAGGTASYSTNTLTSGTHKISASYQGNVDFVPSTAALTQLIH